MVRHSIPQLPVTDDAVMHRAVIDHTANCEACNRASGPCPILLRLKEFARVATDLWVARVDAALSAYEATIGEQAESPHCRAARLMSAAEGHGMCARAGCVCGCHKGVPQQR